MPDCISPLLQDVWFHQSEIRPAYCPEHNLIIEIDGCSHDNKYEYDLERHNYLTELGFFVMHIDDLDIKTRMNGVLENIAGVITTTPALRATPSPAKGIYQCI